MSSLLQNILILVGIILIGALGFYLYSQNVSLDMSDQNSEVSNQIALETAEFLRRLNELKAIELDGSLLSDERFRSLVHLTPPVPSLNVGDSNPFDVN